VDGHRLIVPARRLADEQFEAWAEVLARGYGGLVSKDDASPYVGGRTLKWLKVRLSRGVVLRIPGDQSPGCS
jgi:ATP-dependent DNA ligase